MRLRECPFGIYRSVAVYDTLCEASGKDCEPECNYNQLTVENLKNATAQFNLE